MISRSNKKRALLLSLASVLGFSSPSLGAEYWLRAETLTKTMPDASVVTMWGFAQCTNATYSTCSPATVPGPRLTVPPGDTLLRINLRNNLTGPYVEPVSIVIPGQTAVMAPIKFTDGSGRQRVRSFTAEAPPDNVTTISYSWDNMKPGTYLYQSGTHPSVQVQMGMYGAVTKDAAAGQAYGPETAYAAEALLLYSEIDPVLHSHVAAGTYGTPPPVGITSTLDYEPKYFLVNGEPHSASVAPLPVGDAGSAILLRFLNAGLKTHVPLLQGLYMSLVAQDGNLFPYPKQQYAIELPAGKTVDAIIRPTTQGKLALYDRKLSLSNAPGIPGGMLTLLGVSPVAADGLGVFSSGTWWLDTGSGAWEGVPPDRNAIFGYAGAIPISGDWDGNGTSEVAIYDAATWYVDVNGNGLWDGPGIDRNYVFGVPGSVPVAGDWNGSGTTKIGVFASGTWYLDFNGNGQWDGPVVDRTFTFDAGLAGGTPVTGDWDGSGISRIGMYRDAMWRLDYNGDGVYDEASDRNFYFGFPGAVPVTGDWNRSGVTKIGVYENGLWYVDLSGNGFWEEGTDLNFWFGFAGAVPVTGKW